jgi:hypothetical protein
MNREEVRRLRDLSQRLGSTPRRLLVTAAQSIDDDDATPQSILRSIRDSGTRQCVQADECANLLLTPVASFARDTLGTALSALWRTSAAERN